MPRRQRTVGVVMLMQRQGDLFDPVLALQPRGGFAHALDAGKRQAGEDGDDGENDEELDQGEGGTATEDYNQNTIW
jgi:hypothetical protein